jgi:serine/threonine protein kinase
MSDDAFDEVLRQADARLGRTLKGKWTLDQVLGVGGMAAVYAATHRNHKRVAVKVLHPELSFNAAVRQRFLREGYVANMVQHPGAVSVDDDDVGEDGCAFLVMELLDGETLEARWERKGRRLPTTEVLAFMDRVLDTLTAAHARGVVHRDLKPENLFFTREAQIKVLDFGIARVRELSGSTKTQTGSLMGTPAFMSPEQARGRWDEVDAQSDLWAIGATIFTLLTGQLVHIAQTTNEALVLAVTQPARSLGDLRPDLSDAVVRFVDRALAYDKAERWPDSQTMQQALRETYATLEGEWDEQTVLHQAAASLPDGPLSIPNAATSVTTALGTSTSAHPQSEPFNNRKILLGAGGLAVLVMIVVIASAVTGGQKEQAPSTDAPHAAAPPVAEVKPVVPIVVAHDPPVPPTLRIEDLPAAEQARSHPTTPQPSATIANPYTTASKQVQPSPVVAKPAGPRPIADPFAGRE